MDNTTLVPKNLITYHDPGNDVHDVTDVRPGGNRVDFWQDRDDKPYVVIDIDQPGQPHSHATVVAVKILNGNLETVRLYKKATDTDKDWVPLVAGAVSVTNEAIHIPGEQVGMLKVVPETNIPDVDAEHFIFSVDVAVCEYGVGEYFHMILGKNNCGVPY